MSKKFVSPANYITPININGLDGRVLNLKAANKKNKKEILFIYDINSNLERWWGLDSALKHYANVAAVDLPGIGGMDSFFSIGIKPSIDNYADYIDSFIKLKYKKKKFSIVCIGFGFVVVTRMLQKNPQLSARVNLVVGINAYAHYDDLKISGRDKLQLFAENAALSIPLVPWLFNSLGYSSPFLSYRQGKLARNKKLDQFTISFLLDLDKEADIRTSKYIAKELTKLDNCGYRVEVPLWHVGLGDIKQTLKPAVVEQHLKIIFSKYRFYPAKLTKVPFIISDQKTGQKVLPAALRRELRKPVR